MNIYLPIEIKSRELESKLLLAFEAASRGHEVLIGPLSIIFSWGPVGILKPGVFHDKSLTPTKSKLSSFQKIVERHGIITSQDEESGLLDESYIQFAKTRYSEESLKYSSKIFCWGNLDFQGLIKTYPQFNSKFVISGSPRVDLWRPAFKQFYKFNDSQTKFSCGYILIISKFGIVLNKNRLWSIIQSLRKSGFFQRGYDEFSDYDLYAYQVSLLKEFIKAIRYLSNYFPNKSIIIRPHPIEDLESWPNLLGDLENVRVIREGSVNAWINNASVVVHNGCTSAFEARVNEKPTIAYIPIKSDQEIKVPNEISYHCFTKEELALTVRTVLEEGQELEINNEKKAILTDRLAIDNDKFSFEKIISEWESLNQVHLSVPNNWTYVSLRLRISRNKKRILSKFIKDKKSIGIATGHKFPVLNKNEIEDYKRKFSESFRNYSGIKIRKIFDKTFVISKRIS